LADALLGFALLDQGVVKLVVGDQTLVDQNLAETHMWLA
jgi:hypothetical protein